MDPGVAVESVVFRTKWFELVARQSPVCPAPHYSIKTLDYVGVVAVTARGELLLVRQFRPAVWETTLELPSGHVEPGQTPEQAARAELLEETGYQAARFECLGDYSPDTGRLSNRLWGFFAADPTPVSHQHSPEPGIEPVLYRGAVGELLQDRSFCSALNRATLLAAVAQGKIRI
jgi:8-oxo-dGTP pyrophosphatase MutT (NUDIX family)